MGIEIEITNPPEQGWKKGISQEHTLLTFEIQVCLTEKGLYSRTATPKETQDLIEGLPMGGLDRITFAFLLEALRREAWLQVLMSEHKSDLAKNYKSLDDKTKKEEIFQLMKTMKKVINKNMDPLLSPLMQEAVVQLNVLLGGEE